MKKEIKDNHISMKEEEKQIKRPASYCQKLCKTILGS